MDPEVKKKGGNWGQDPYVRGVRSGGLLPVRSSSQVITLPRCLGRLKWLKWGQGGPQDRAGVWLKRGRTPPPRPGGPGSFQGPRFFVGKTLNNENTLGRKQQKEITHVSNVPSLQVYRYINYVYLCTLQVLIGYPLRITCWGGQLKVDSTLSP